MRVLLSLDQLPAHLSTLPFIEEFIFKCTHDKTIDWLLPAVPPTGKKLEIPMLGVVNVRGDRLYHG